jgi:ribosome-binding protein aMBF1 (putative translation factor)
MRITNVCSQYETGWHAPMLSTARRLARALDIDLLWLLDGQGPAPWD